MNGGDRLHRRRLCRLWRCADARAQSIRQHKVAPGVIKVMTAWSAAATRRAPLAGRSTLDRALAENIAQPQRRLCQGGRVHRSCRACERASTGDIDPSEFALAALRSRPRPVAEAARLFAEVVDPDERPDALLRLRRGTPGDRCAQPARLCARRRNPAGVQVRGLRRS